MSPRLIALPMLIVLGACASQQDRCIENAVQERLVVEALITETEANIARGYALEDRIPTPGTSLRICSGFGLGNPAEFILCQVAQPNTPEQRPVAIDGAAERAKLATLRARHAQLVPQTTAAIAQCRAAYPQG